MLFETPTIIGDNKTEKPDDKIQERFSGLVGVIVDFFHNSENEKEATERRLLSAYRNYRGEYDSSILGNIDADKSSIFVKITKTKVLAAYGQIIEVLFSTKHFPIGVEATEVPEGISEYAHLDTSKPPEAIPEDRYGFEGDNKGFGPGATASTLQLGDLEDKYGKLNLTVGPSISPKMPQIKPAKEAAHNMERVIQDQLDSTNAGSALRYAVFEMCLLGTGILKGPFTASKVIHNWKRNEKKEVIYDPITKNVPEIRSVSVWDLYPDPSAKTIEDAEWVIERHALNRAQLRDLMRQPFFNKSAIEECLLDGSNYQTRHYEAYLRDSDVQTGLEDRFEVLEYWGMMDANLASEAGLDIEEESELSQVPINAWICGPHILRLVKNPFIPSRLPYSVCPYEIHPYQIFGIGVAENMDDSQQVMNGLARQTIDNINLSGNLVFDIDESSLVAGQDFSIKAGKIFRRQSGLPGQAIYTHKFPNVTNETMIVFDKFRQLSDEQTGIPSYSHGQTGVIPTTRTASGMSMLMGASALNIKTVIKNVDDYMLYPIGEAMFAWNMQFNDDDTLPIRGDLEIKARGTSALMQKEIRSQRLMTLMQVGSNPYAAPHIKWPAIIKEVAESLDVEPEEIINDPETAALYARLIGGLPQSPGAGALQQPQGSGEQQVGMGGPGQVPPGANPLDASGVGGGNIGTGNVPMPGENAFSAATTQSPRRG